VGLTGENGTGKTSLIKLILGELQADIGEFFVSKKLITADVAQEIASSENSAIDYVIDGDKEFRDIEATLKAAEKNNETNKLG
jgi:ATP-binding cassette subfamily F protein 3